MSNSNDNIVSPVSKAEAALQVRPDITGGTSINEFLAEMQLAMNESVEARRILGPLVGRLRAAQNANAESAFTWVPVLQGHLAIGHRPRLKTIQNMHSLGTTHVLTLLSESEDAARIGKEVKSASLGWLWLPLTSGAPPSASLRASIVQTFDAMRETLNEEASIYVHCSAGIHRTGMITYAFLRYVNYAPDVAMEMLHALRQETANGVGDERKEWGEQFG